MLLLLLPFAALALANVLSPQNFDETIAHGVWFVEHFSPYCRHCRNFEPTWTDLVSHFDALPDPGVHLAQVNCALNGDLCNENGVSGYPQMNLYRDGELVDTYSANREFHLLLDYLNAHAEHAPLPSSSDSPLATTLAPSEPPQAAPAPSEPPPPAPASPLLVQTPRSSDPNPSGAVVPLDPQSFDAFVQQGPAFVKFFAPWCGHCKKLAPIWQQLGRRMQSKLNIAEVDCEQHKALCASHNIAGFPTLAFFAHGTKTEYTAGRSYEQLVSFAEKASNPNMRAIDASALVETVRAHDVLYLLLHDPSDHRTLNDITKASQSLLGSPPVFVSTSSELFAKYGLPPVLLAFKDGDAREPVSTLSLASHSDDALRSWLYLHRFPSSLELTKDVFQQVMYAQHKPLVLIVATPKGQQEAVSSKLHEIAQKWRLRLKAGRADTTSTRDVVFTWMDGGQWEKWMKDMYGIKLGSDPVVVVADHDRLVYYDKDGSGNAISLNSVSVASALEAVLGGTARPKHSRTMLELGVQSLNTSLMNMEKWIVAHPYLTGLALLSLVGVVVMALKSLITDEFGDWEAEKRYTKRDRLD